MRFADAVDRMHQDGTAGRLELGPGEVLVKMPDDCLPEGAGGERPPVFSTARDWRGLREEADVA